ncbi:MAG: LysM peptidoglycan-binding domain-containing protein [Actinomycetota bacterium]
MSAGAVGVFVPQPVRMPSRTDHPRLRLVGAGERGSADQRILHGKRPFPDEGTGALSFKATRLTRRGRLVVTLMVALAVAVLAVALASSVDAASPRIDHAMTVSAGQTLSEVAATQLPGLSVGNAVARIQLANGLNTSQVHAGQLLLIPKLP